VSKARTILRALVVTAVSIAIAGTTATAASAAPSTRDINKKITDAQNKLEDVVESYNKLRISLKQTIADENTLAASIGPARAALKVANAQMKSIAATAYMNGEIGTVNVLLDGPGDLIDRMQVLDQVSRTRSRDIAAFTATTENYTQRQAALKITQARQAAEVKELAARKAKIEADIKKLRAMKLRLTGSATDRGTGGYTGSVPSISGAAGKAVSYAYAAAKRHAPYGYGQDGPDRYDCSGLTMAAWRAAGKSLPHNAAAQYSATARISRSSLRPGDLVFYRSLGHVGLYVGNNQIIDAPHEGAYVNVRSINIMTPYGYGRVR
jgi:cell wall-associated NlpC family hydrolase